MPYARQPDDIPFEGEDDHIGSRSYLFETEECIRCGDAPAVDRMGYCGHCHWVVIAEVEDGMYRLGRYLHHWSKFREWEARQAPAAA